jgi:hypothetical protein
MINLNLSLNERQFSCLSFIQIDVPGLRVEDPYNNKYLVVFCGSKWLKKTARKGFEKVNSFAFGSGFSQAAI